MRCKLVERLFCEEAEQKDTNGRIDAFVMCLCCVSYVASVCLTDNRESVTLAISWDHYNNIVGT